MKWTAKLPALIVGIVLFIIGLFVSRSKWRYAAVGGFLFFSVGAGFIYWSLTIKEWCRESNIQQSSFSSAFAPSFHECLRMKGWLEP
jgi:hypothetical protein